MRWEPCRSDAPTSTVDETVTASGGSGLTHDAATDTYTFVWKTDKAWSNTCRRLTVEFSDGSRYHASVEPDHFGSAGLALGSGDECDAHAPGSTVVLDARGYEPGALVAIVMQFVGKEAVAVATVSADDLGGVRAEVELPASAAESLGGFELIGVSPTGVLLNEAAFFVDEDGCGPTVRGWSPWPSQRVYWLRLGDIGPTGHADIDGQRSD